MNQPNFKLLLIVLHIFDSKTHPTLLTVTPNSNTWTLSFVQKHCMSVNQRRIIFHRTASETQLWRNKMIIPQMCLEFSLVDPNFWNWINIYCGCRAILCYRGYFHEPGQFLMMLVCMKWLMAGQETDTDDGYFSCDGQLECLVKKGWARALAAEMRLDGLNTKQSCREKRKITHMRNNTERSRF